MGKVFKYLEKYRNKNFFKNSKENKFFQRYKGLLTMNPNFLTYLEIDNNFDVIKANIIIKSIINKEELDSVFEKTLADFEENQNLESFSKHYEECIKDLNYIHVEDAKIYIPFFNTQTNLVYYKDFNKMQDYPYLQLRKKFDSFIINPFQTYNISLFDSKFVNLIRVGETESCVAYFHPELYEILIINNQGSIDNIIYLFDKFIKNPNKENILERIKPLVEAYFNNEMNDFIDILYKNNFISKIVFSKICKAKGIL
mgnify:CR=1 FL=1